MGLRHVTAPTLAVADTHDPIVWAPSGHLPSRLIPDGRLHTIAGGGHLFVLGQPAEAAALDDDCLREPK